MLKLRINNMSLKMVQWVAQSAATRIDSTVVDGRGGKNVLLRDMQIKGGTASDVVSFLPGYPNETSTLKAAALINATTIVLVGDTANGKLNGYTPTTSDYVIVAHNTGWQVLKIGGVTLAAGQASLTSLAACDGGTGIAAAALAGATAVVVKAANIASITVGASTFNPSTLPQFVGGVSGPVGIIFDSKGANAHSAFGIGEWID